MSIRPDFSRAIHKQLANGAMLNKSKMDGNLLVPNPLFDEVVLNEGEYRQQYNNIGYELTQLGDAFFLNELDKSETLSDAAAKIQTLLSVLFAGCKLIHRPTGMLTDWNAGLEMQHLAAFNENDDFTQLIRAVGMKKDLQTEVLNNLVARGIAFLNHREALALTEGGIALLDHMLLQVSPEVST